MTKEDANRTFGPVIMETSECVVRGRGEPNTDGKGSPGVSVHIHKKDKEGKELLPLAYMTGVNCLVYP